MASQDDPPALGNAQLPQLPTEVRDSADYPIRACAWPRRLKQGPVRLIEPSEFPRWILFEDARLLVIDKPGDVVCHPSKAGPWSSLVGAVREHGALEAAHLVFRLDRETSGLVVFAKDARTASRLQKAVQERRVRKAYQALLTGNLATETWVDQPLGDDEGSPVFVKTRVRPDGAPARTCFQPVARGGGFTLANVITQTGRKHQIRAHAHWLGHPMVGDKIYGPDERCFIEFIDNGWTPALAERLLLPRQALHCAVIDLRPAGFDYRFVAPLPQDLRAFCDTRGVDWKSAPEPLGAETGMVPPAD